MEGVLTGFAAIGAVIAVGYALGHRGHLGRTGRDVLSKLAFHVATPALMFTTLARADLSVILSQRLLVSALATAATAALFAAAGVLRRWGTGRTTIGALCASYVNAGNLGIPIAVYVLGDAALVAPVLLLQQMVITPAALTVLDLTRPDSRKEPLWRRLTTPLRNPMAVGSLSGVAVAAAGWTIPGPALAPLTLIGNMSVPAVLMAFGISLHGSAMPVRGPERGPVLLSVALKCVAQPVIAWALGTWVCGLGHAAVLDVTVISALPAAQNLFTYATRYEVGEELARESILVSTLASVPALVVVAALLG
ncbi:AEC family transporter [Streptomyces sp. TS71-3]|uniref:AEC family transporter n=1 Tax=Streptomyces sp. TS71-3 TaxID=2733862 RepID=UPI001B01DB86|nr:AEC family transporter [Streptomyces sp. TS71-3]GHJ34775.1 membrane protein [Streptomyces sp. TS71-3]